jgi:hypothetical protein
MMFALAMFFREYNFSGANGIAFAIPPDPRKR